MIFYCSSPSVTIFDQLVKTNLDKEEECRKLSEARVYFFVNPLSSFQSLILQSKGLHKFHSHHSFYSHFLYGHALV